MPKSKITVVQPSDLNTKEVWSKKPSCKSYLHPNPQINLNKGVAGNVKKAKLIKNGTISSSILVEGTTYKVNNTCAIDSIIHLIGFLALGDTDIKQILDENKNECEVLNL